MSLPSYQEATTPVDPWSLVALELPESMYVTCCLVSKHFNELFSPLIWSDPANIMLANPDQHHQQRKIRKFLKAVKQARPQVLGLVITLDLRTLKWEAPPDNSKLVYTGSNSDRNQVCTLVRFFRTYFSSLKIVIVDRFIGFDSAAASMSENVAHAKDDGVAHPGPLPMPAIFSAVGCSQLDIRAVINHRFSTCLIYLDVSGTSKRNLQGLFNRHQVPHLRVLKMRHLHLTTQELVPLLRELTCRLYSLDVRNNLLTDDVIRWLLALCFPEALGQRSNLRLEVGSEGLVYSPGSRNSPEGYADDAPRYNDARYIVMEQGAALSGGRLELQPDELNDVVRYSQEHERMDWLRKHNILPEEDPMLLAKGLTHLHLADNKLTSDALQSILMGTNQLQLLDFGGAPQTRHRFSATNPNLKPLCQPDSARLLCLEVSQRLQCLRVHHSIITHTPTLLTKGEFHLSEAHRIRLSEKDYAEEEMVHWPEYWNPNLNPYIESLTLTDVPRWSEGLVVNRIIQVLRIAAIQESQIAKATPMNARRAWNMLLGLRYLRLEFVPIVQKELTTSPSISANSDADIFARESASDFSFFDQVTDSSSDFSFFTGEALPPQKVPSSLSIGRRDALKQMGRDVIAELRSYRRKTKMACEAERDRLQRFGVHVPLGAPHYHWTGRLQFIC